MLDEWNYYETYSDSYLYLIFLAKVRCPKQLTIVIKTDEQSNLKIMNIRECGYSVLYFTKDFHVSHILNN